MIAIKVDVTKLNKDKFFKGKNGAIYADLVLFENAVPDQFGNDFAVKQSQTQDERKSGVKSPYVGNGKYIGRNIPENRTEASINYDALSTQAPSDCPF